ncbi:hypothetical protein FRX31_010131 [Thalictrum thalictroides]|uniref:Uncharacterized protein n=1 Tax=Thalictrum thalictroides TaxID=46969 RepID=A0A7J6WW29_THATH|nr:hypothetical protein FRX31_010131 [Thalictrum thalictroides]
MMPVRTNIDHDIIPRIRGWAKDHRNRRVSEVDHNTGLARQQIELRGKGGMIWHPWRDAAVFRTPTESVPEGRGRVVSNACFRSRELTKTRMMLMAPSGWHAWYLGDRCWRQWNDSPLIPYPPPPDMQGRDVPMGTLEYCRQYLEWPGAENFVLPDGDYDRYWARVSIGPLVREATYRSVNIDAVTSQALRPGLSIGSGFEGHPQGVDDPWQCSVFTSQGETLYVPVHSAPESYVTELTQQFEMLDMDALRRQLIQQSALNYGLRQTLLDTSRQSFEYLQAERDHVAQLQTQLQPQFYPRDSPGLEEISSQSQSHRRRTRRRRSLEPTSSEED